MKNYTHWFILLLVPFLFTGCYTQFQTFDRFPVDDKYDNYYAWENFDEKRNYPVEQASSDAYYNNGDTEYLDEELALEQSDIYYKDFETEDWYKDNYADRYYWFGYDDGYNEGYHNGMRDSYLYGYTPWAYSSWYNYNHRYFHRNNVWFGARHNFYIGFNSWYAYSPFYYDYGYGFNRYPYYGWGYSSWDYWGHHPFYTHITVYNSYHKTQKYSRNADLYRKGARNSGLVNNGRTRASYGNDNGVNSRGSGITRSRSKSSSGRSSGITRSRGSSSRGINVGRSSGSSSRGTSVGRSRSGSSSRGTGSSVGKSRSGNKSSGKSRSRGGDGKNYSSNLSARTIYLQKASQSDNSTYSIPARRVKVDNAIGGRNSVSISSIFNGRGFGNFVSTGSFSSGNSSARGISRSSSTNRVNVGNTSSSRSRSVIKSNSSSGRSSSVTSSRNSSSSSKSSKKRSRGGNN